MVARERFELALTGSKPAHWAPTISIPSFKVHKTLVLKFYGFWDELLVGSWKKESTAQANSAQQFKAFLNRSPQPVFTTTMLKLPIKNNHKKSHF